MVTGLGSVRAYGEGGEGDFGVSVTEYGDEDYTRHHRMEEEDRLRGRSFSFAPGLEIICSVDDVNVTINGRPVGKTPWESSSTAPGVYRVGLRRRGFTPRELRVDVFSDRRVVVEVEMLPSTGRIRLSGVPGNAVIRFNRKRFAGDVLEVIAGTGVLIIHAFGWEAVESAVEVRAGEELVWHYPGAPVPFGLGAVSVSPGRLPVGDAGGFRIGWRADAPGRGELVIRDPDGRAVHSEALEFGSAAGYVRWVPEGGLGLVEGDYLVEVRGRGRGRPEGDGGGLNGGGAAGNGEGGLNGDGAAGGDGGGLNGGGAAGNGEGGLNGDGAAGGDGLETDGAGLKGDGAAGTAAAVGGFRIDNRFSRSPVPFDFSGAAMLPPGSGAGAVGVSLNVGAEVPLGMAFLYSPAARIELRSGFRMRFRTAGPAGNHPKNKDQNQKPRGAGGGYAPANSVGIGASLGVSWRITRYSGLFAANLQVGVSYEGWSGDFKVMPRVWDSRDAAGMHAALPMELNPGRWRFMLTPRADVMPLGSSSVRRRIGGPLRAAGGLEAGIFYDGRSFLIGILSALQSPDVPGGFFDWGLSAGLRGRIDMSGGRSYIGLRADLGFYGGPPTVSMGVEVGIL